MASSEFIKVDVPEGLPPQSVPTNPQSRYKEGEVELRHMQEEDLEAVARGIIENFPDVWWAIHEPPETRPSLKVRIGRLAKRLKPWLKQRKVHGIVACKCGAVIGFAGWHEANTDATFPTKYSAYPKIDFPPNFVPNLFRQDVPDALHWPEMEGWSQAEVHQMWEHVRPTWQAEFGGFDCDRVKLMGRVPHWYLSPLYVDEEHRGHGVASKLLHWAIDKADATDPPTPLYVQTSLNGRPTYLHLGYKDIEDDVEGKDIILIKNKP